MFFGLEHLQKLHPYIKSNNELRDFKYFALARLREISKILPIGSTLRLEIAPNNGFYRICIKTRIFKGPIVKEVAQSPNIFLAFANCQNRLLQKASDKIKDYDLPPLPIRTHVVGQSVELDSAEGLLHYPSSAKSSQNSSSSIDHQDQKSS